MCHCGLNRIRRVAVLDKLLRWREPARARNKGGIAPSFLSSQTKPAFNTCSSGGRFCLISSLKLNSIPGKFGRTLSCNRKERRCTTCAMLQQLLVVFPFTEHPEWMTRPGGRSPARLHLLQNLTASGGEKITASCQNEGSGGRSRSIYNMLHVTP